MGLGVGLGWAGNGGKVDTHVHCGVLSEKLTLTKSFDTLLLAH